MNKIAALLLSMVVFSGCRLVIPSAAENQALMQRGTFVGDTPAWAAQGAALGSRRSSIGMGIMPTSFSSSTATNPMTSGDEDFSKTIAEKKAESYQQKIAAEKSGLSADTVNQAKPQKATEPLGRISSICPTIEKLVTEAITTVDRPLKVRKLEGLAQRCQNSPDLWYWLAVDYAALGRFGEAERALNLVLSLMPEMKEANELLIKVRESRTEQMNKERENFAPKLGGN